MPRRSCAIGSVKSNIGHTDSAAGAAALGALLFGRIPLRDGESIDQVAVLEDGRPYRPGASAELGSAGARESRDRVGAAAVDQQGARPSAGDALARERHRGGHDAVLREERGDGGVGVTDGQREVRAPVGADPGRDRREAEASDAGERGGGERSCHEGVA